MNRVEIIKPPCSSRPKAGSTVVLFGKEFALDPVSCHFRVALHGDFPLIDEDDLNDFSEYCKDKDTITVSGCTAKVHPYRLMYIDDDGYDAHLADIPQTIRGNRHLYPQVYSFVPALVGVPPGAKIDRGVDPEALDMFIMPETKLLDRTILCDYLLIKALQGDPNSLEPRGNSLWKNIAL
jgi:hypothetical protein